MEKIKSPFSIEAKEVILGHSKKHPISAKPISFKIPNGVITAVLGPNGTGKSTLINAFINSGTLISGNISYLGHNLSRIDAKELSHLVSILPQENPFALDLRVKNFLELAFLPRVGLFKSLPSIDSEEFSPIVKLLELRPLFYKLLKNLSSGERQRVSLARTLLQQSKLLLLDEPTNHLDPRATSEFWKTLVTYQAQSQIDVLVSSHDLAWIEKECHWILALKKGDLIFSGSKDDFFRENLSDQLYD